MKFIALLSVLLILLSFSSSCTTSQTYGPYYGKVVDSETKEPIEGAAVLVVFYTSEPGPAGSITRYADALETVTDKNGDFSLPAHKVTSTKFLHLLENYGYFTIYKPGYGCYPKHRDAEPMFVPNGTLPEKKFVTVELPRLKTMEERKEAGTPTVSGSVPYEKQKYLIELMNKEREFLGYPGKIERKAWELHNSK